MSTTQLSARLVIVVHDDVARYGVRGVETGAFLLKPRGSNRVTTVALAGTTGVVRRRNEFAVTGRALAQLFRHATAHNLVVTAQVHSHGGAAFLSDTDLRHGFAVEGFTTAIVPHFRRPSSDPRSWGWWRYSVGGWNPAEAFVVADPPHEATSVIFDEDGVRAG